MTLAEILRAYGIRPDAHGDRWILVDYSPNQPRDQNGRFATSSGASGVPNVREGIRLLRERLEKANTTKEYRAIAREGASLLKGMYGCSLVDMPHTAVFVGSQFVDESAKYFASAKPSEQKEVAERLLLMYEHFEEFLKTGARTGWRDGGERHPNSEFCTISKRLIYKSRSIRFTLDVERPKVDWESSVAQAHNSSSRGNPGFDFKADVLNFRKDSATPMIQVVGFSIE